MEAKKTYSQQKKKTNKWLYIRAADLSEEVTKRRAARYLAPDAGVRPYSRLQAEGYKMLSELEKVNGTDSLQSLLYC